MKLFLITFLVVCHLIFLSGQEIEDHHKIINPFIIDPKVAARDAPQPNTTVCYDLVGCFDNNSPFNNSLNYLPISPEELQTNFNLYTSLRTKVYENLSYVDDSTILNSRFNKLYPLKIVIHGFQNSGQTSWVQEMARNLLTAEKEKVNVITVDWGIGAVFPLYYNASANTRLVGRQTCLLVKKIRKLFYGDLWSKEFNIHCIGHSLGAHTCGYAAAECDSRFDRVTAMDPAGPNFEGTDPKVRIDPTDAKFVDVIHSNGDLFITGNFGMQAPTGHVDFYPNGGKQQPGCPGLLSLIGGLFTNASASVDGVSCSHGRAVDFFSESIISPCSFFAYPCDSITSFEKGNCLDCSNGGCTPMGYYASVKSRGVKYLMTNGKTPFCANAHLSEIYISPTNVKTAGELNLILKIGSTSQTISLTKQSDDLIANDVIRKVFVAETEIKSADSSSIQFNKKPKPFLQSDPNAPQVIIDKIKISNSEVENEIYSECNRGFTIPDKQTLPVSFKSFDCQLTSKTDTESTIKKLISLLKFGLNKK